MQDFPTMIQSGGLYIDKTAYVYKMAHTGGRYFFLSRPRRFGKSLLISTLQAYFEGRRELFDGLAVSQLEKDWTAYPVIRLDLSAGKYYDLDGAEQNIDGILGWEEKKFGISGMSDVKFGKRLTNLIRTAYEQTGRQVVVLIDEYDAPMLDSITKPDLQDQIRERIRDLFSPLKSEAPYLRFVFLTGISKFSQLSVFSELNNLKMLTFDPKYEGVCGITEEELLTQMRPDIEALAESMSRWASKALTYDDTLARLKRMYDGYHFSKDMTDVYNPWSLINAFDMGDIQNYWFSIGTPSSLINLLRTKQLNLPDLEHLEVNMGRFDAPTERITDPIPVLFQSGYLTLKSYNEADDSYTLGFPNQEVYEGFSTSLYNYYCPDYIGSSDQMTIVYKRLRSGSIDFAEFLKSVQKWYRGIPYSITDKNQNEQLYQSLLYALLAGCGADVQAEAQTSDGRMDIVLKMPDRIYILEFKYDKSVEEAMEQMERKDYAVLFAADPRPVSIVGLNINSERRTIDSYDILPCKD